jgi:hypothetical protein
MPKVLNIEKIGLKAVRAMIASGQAVYIGGGGDFGRYGAWPESKWANEFGDRPDGSRAVAIAKYRAWIMQQPKLMAALPELRGKDLLCWCAPERCHGDVLLDLANR